MSGVGIVRNLLAAIAVAAIGYGQKPVIFPNGVVNAATYYGGPPGAEANVYGGSIASIFGENLAATNQSASSLPLPTTLGGTSVSVDGILAPIFFVSPGQINIQMPSDANFTTGLVVTTSAGASDAVPRSKLPIFPSVGIFTQDASGCGPGALLNVGKDGSVSLNSASNSVSPGDFITLFGTGLGPAYYILGGEYFDPPPDGTPSPASPLSYTITQPLVVFDLQENLLDSLWPIASAGARPSFAGKAPGLVGVDQINVQIPIGVREGCAVPLIVKSPSTGLSQPVTISIHTGGGQCVDPPMASFGMFTWERSVSSGSTPSGESDTLTATIPAAPGMPAPPPITDRSEGASFQSYNLFGPFCQIPGYGSLDAGKISAAGPGFGSIQATPSIVKGRTIYTATLPNGTIQPGSFSVTASGGSDVSAFQSSVRIGSGIQVTSSFPAGSTISPFEPLTVNWTGGDPNTWVTFKLIVHQSGIDDDFRTLTVRASEGTATMYTSGFPMGTLGVPMGLPGQTEIVLEVDPDPAQVTTLAVPGLSLGGQLTWKYTYHFADLTQFGF